MTVAKWLVSKTTESITQNIWVYKVVPNNTSQNLRAVVDAWIELYCVS
jgi:hypothetical protein